MKAMPSTTRWTTPGGTWQTGGRVTEASALIWISLLESPIRSPATNGSYPLLLYGSFWYQHIPESNWTGNLHGRLRYLGSAIYAVALIPTAFFLLGLAALGKRLPEFGRRFNRSRPADQRLLTIYAAAAVWLTTLAMLLLAIDKYHVWSIMQCRFLFPALFGGLGAFAAGVESVGRSRLPAVVLKVAMIFLLQLFALYFVSEIGLRLLQMNRSAAANLRSDSAFSFQPNSRRYAIRSVPGGLTPNWRSMAITCPRCSGAWFTRCSTTCAAGDSLGVPSSILYVTARSRSRSASASAQPSHFVWSCGQSDVIACVDDSSAMEGMASSGSTVRLYQMRSAK